MTEKQMWGWVKKAGWKKDPDSDRVKAFFLAKLSAHACLELYNFLAEKHEALDKKFRNSWWLGKQGVGVSDDGWSDLRAEVIGRGQEFYEGITAKKLRAMADAADYTESFIYALHPEIDAEQALWVKLYGDDWILKDNDRVSLQDILKEPKELPLYLGLDPFLDRLIGEVLNGTDGRNAGENA